MKFRLLMVVALAATLTAAACGGDDDDTGDDTNGNGADATRTTTGQTPSGGGGSATPGTSGDDDFSDLLADASDKTYAVSYEIEIVSDGKTQQGTVTFAQEPPKSRMEISLGDDADLEELILIEDGTSSFTCFKSGDSGQCMKSGATGGLGDNFTLFDVKRVLARVKEDKDIKEVSGQKIAGRDSRCFEGKFPDTEEEGLFCIDKTDGILTLMDSASTKFKATEVSTKVDDKLFEPPYPLIG
ncbi:MAG: hypothetical protein IH609_17575 [Dehalococcoidia bacterium]|nr:hypothetical protein [Dehalococcoidia bacterium]